MRFKKFIIISFFLIASFFVGHFTFAADLMDQEQLSFSNYFGYYNNFPAVGQRFVASSTNISALYFPTNQNMSTTTISICKGVPNNLSQSDIQTNGLACNWAGNTLIGSETIKATYPSGGYPDPSYVAFFKFSSPIAVDSGQNYYFISYPQSDFGNYTLTTRTQGSGRIINDGQWPEQAAYIIYYDDTYAPPTGWSIYANYPLTGFNIASTSIQFITHLTKPSDKEGYVEIKLYPNNIITYENELRYPYGRIGGTSTSTRWTLQTEALIDGAYSWYADLSDYDTGQIMATTSLESFSVGALGDLSFDNPLGLTEAEICIGVATSTIMGAIECAFKKISAWILYPTQASVNKLYYTYQDLRASFPFNAFFELTDALDAAIATTTLTITDNLSIPMITATGTFYMLPVIGSSTISNFIGQNNATLFRNSIAWILWLVAAFMIFFQVRNL